MKSKKYLSLLLALVMVLSLAVPFASATTTTTLDVTEVTDMNKIDGGTSTTVNTTFNAPVLSLTVPKKVAALLNPYGVASTINKDTAIEASDVSRKILSADNLIVSRSSVPLKIKATATAEIVYAASEEETNPNAWTLSKQNLVVANQKKEALVYMLFGDVDTSTLTTEAAVTAFSKTNKTATDTPYTGISRLNISYPAVAADLDNVTFKDATTAKDGIIISDGEGKETLITKKLGQGDVTYDSDGKPVYNAVSAVAFMFDGDMITQPKTSQWSKDDKLNVSVVWKFLPDEQVQPVRGTAFVEGSNGLVAATAFNLSDLVDDANASPDFELKNPPTGVAATSAGVLTITNAALQAAKGSAPAVDDKILVKFNATYKDDDATTPATVSQKFAITASIVDSIVAGTYDISDAAVTQIAAQASVASDGALEGAPAGVTVTTDGKIDVAKSTVIAANGGTEPAAGDVVYIGPFTYKGKTSASADVSKTIVLKITTQA